MIAMKTNGEEIYAHDVQSSSGEYGKKSLYSGTDAAAMCA
jgi:hypothetical protein